MQKNDDKFHQSGICRRIFNFVSKFMSPLMPSPFPGFAEVPVPNGRGSMDEPLEPKNPSTLSEEDVNHGDQKMSKYDNTGSAIEVHFKQTEEDDLEYWAAIDKLGSSVHVDQDLSQFKKADNISCISSAMAHAKDKVREKEKDKEKSEITEPLWNMEPPFVQVNATSLRQGTKKSDQTSRGKSFQETPQGSKRRGAKKVVGAEDKGKLLEREQISAPLQTKGTATRSPENFLSASINEKSDAFLRSRKEAMRRNIG